MLETLFKIGSLAGLFSFIWLFIKDLTKFFRRPKLKITFEKSKDLRTWTFPNGTTRKFATLHIVNKRKEVAKRCVATLKIIEKPSSLTHLESKYSLHWADIPYNLRTTGAEPVDIGPEEWRLDVIFTDASQFIDGCWIAMPIALSGALTRNQAYLPPGSYKVKIEVKCENGKGDRGTFRIISPNKWTDLDFEKLKFLEK